MSKLENNSIPVNIADFIIDGLSKEMFMDPSKKFCYASIVDDYIIRKLYDNLNEGLKDIIADEDKRKRHILDNMIYGISLSNARTRLVKARSIIKNIYTKNILEDYISDMPKFDFIIQNPPYGQSSPEHLKFLIKGIELLNENGKMAIIEPGIHLINIRHNKKFDEIKNKLNNITEKIIIDNYKKEFNSNQKVTAFSITFINLNKNNDNIIYKCCGEKEKLVNNIFDCNLIGNYNDIWNILLKIKSYGDVFKQHIVNHKKPNYSNNDWFLRFSVMMPHNGYYSSTDYIKHPFGEYYGTYSTSITHKEYSYPVDSIVDKKTNRGNPWDAVYGSKEELINLSYNNLNTKLFCFIQCIMGINARCTCHEYIPWLVDKKYTDEEIYKLFNFTNEEIKLIEKTIKKYERYSPWFKRYMCGPSSVSDEEVQQFMTSLDTCD